MRPEDIPVFPLERPAVRPLEIIPAEIEDKQVLVVRDPLGVIDGVVLGYNPLLMVYLELADGMTTVLQMSQAVKEVSGQDIPASVFQTVTTQLDEALLLQSERFVQAYKEKRDAYLESPVRPATVLQLGEDRLEGLAQLGKEFRRHWQGVKAPPAELDLPRGSVRAVLAPHIDYDRGGHAYAWAYKALRDYGTNPETLIVLGTSHRPMARQFVATRKNYETPFGVIETDVEVLDALAAENGHDLLADEFAHAGEHTIELQASYLGHLFSNSKMPRIVPILVGSFEPMLAASPRDNTEVVAFCRALRAILDRYEGRVALIGSVDLSHCGMQFGDEYENDPERVAEVESSDQQILQAIETGDPDEFFELFRKTQNETKVCSVAPIYCVMDVMRDRAKPRLLTYDKHNSEDRTCMVSFCSFAFVSNHQVGD